MVRVLLSVLLFVSLQSQAKPLVQAPKAAVPAAAAPASVHFRLSQKKAAELVLLQGAKAKEVNLAYQENRLAAATALATLDWKVTIESGYEYDKTQAFSPTTIADSKYIRYRSSASLQKELPTGTLLGLEYNRLTQNANVVYPSGTTTIPPDNQVQDLLGVTLEQNLWYDSFGRADRALIRASENTYQATEILRADDLENLVMETITLFWDTYVAQENLGASLASREKYKKLLEVVRRKTGSGYANPGELSTALAESEAREQNVKSTSVDYLGKLENLLTTLGLDPKTEIDFEVPDKLPGVPQLPAMNQGQLRAVRSQKLKFEAAQDNLIAAQSKAHPALNLVGKYYSSGSDQSSESSVSAALSGAHPKYYIGLKFVASFGSDLQTEDIINKKALKELEESKLRRQALELEDTKTQAERKVQATFAIAESAFKLKDYREKAVQELNRTYGQGRTDIKTLIDAMNNAFAADVQLSRAIGDYHIALNQLASVRDELIPDALAKETK